ncbi:MAG: DNA polymerase III subunit gamma/tau [Caldisericaceae bacterium]|nr:DNA polymerase III subunit gamma/tau [Caldisericaceae bacterium]
MKYLALYRKYRPQIFEEMVEQKTVVKILQEALRQKKIGHAYLFAGPKGSGKTSLARIFAKGLNCENGPTPTPCMQCQKCLTITNGTNLDVIEIDAASNRRIEEIRDLREKVKYVSISSKYKVYIIDEVHMLTSFAFNALLKTLEEPPENVVFILATTAPEKIPATILSRCERFYFKPISMEGLVQKIKEVAELENAMITNGGAMLIARFSSGSLRNALSFLDQSIIMFDEISEDNVRSLIGIPEEDVFKNLLYNIINNDSGGVLQIISSIGDGGKDGKIFINEFLMYLQDLITGKILGFEHLTDRRDQEILKAMKEQTRHISEKKLVKISFIFANALNDLKFFPDQFFPIQLAALSCIDKETAVISESAEEEKLITNGKLEIKEKNKPEEKVPIDGSDTLGVVRLHWNEIVREIKKESPPLAAMFMRVMPAELRDDLLILIPEKKFYIEMLNKSNNIDILKRILEKVLLKKFRVSFVSPEKEKMFDKKEEIKKAEDIEEVKLIKEEFDGVVTDVAQVKEDEHNEKHE